MKDPRERIIVALIVLLFIISLFSVIVVATDGMNLSARSAALYEPSELGFIYRKNADIRLPMASTTKIMTALVAIENYDMDKWVEIPEEAIGVEGSSLYLQKGERLKMKDLIYALMLRSANDAAEAIAITVAGSIPKFADMMNNRAKSLSLSNTSFENPHGLDSKNHYTTAEELAIIAAEALKNPIFQEICQTHKVVIKNSDDEAKLIVNHNKLLRLYDGAIGVKTGYTKKCGRCLVGAALRDGLMLVTVTIDAPDDWNDHIKLFDYGYSKFELTKIAYAGEYSYEIPVLGSQKEIIQIKNAEELSKILPKNHSKIKSDVKLSRYVSAPIKQNDILGEVVFTMDEEFIGKVDLLAAEDINSKPKKGLFSIFK